MNYLFTSKKAKNHCNLLILKKRALLYYIKFIFIFLYPTASYLSKGWRFLKIRGFFNFFWRVLIFAVSRTLDFSRYKLSRYWAKTTKSAKISTIKVCQKRTSGISMCVTVRNTLFLQAFIQTAHHWFCIGIDYIVSSSLFSFLTQTNYHVFPSNREYAF